MWNCALSQEALLLPAPPPTHDESGRGGESSNIRQFKHSCYRRRSGRPLILFERDRGRFLLRRLRATIKSDLCASVVMNSRERLQKWVFKMMSGGHCAAESFR